MEAHEEILKKTISQKIKVPVEQIGNDDNLVDKYGMDSMAVVETVADLEDALDLRIEDAEARKVRTVNEWLELLNRLSEQKKK